MMQQPIEAANGIDLFCPANRQEWRAWLAENHDQKQAVWLVYHKKQSGRPRLAYSDAVDEALCFGWIDSTAKPIDAHTYRQFFCRRKPTSTWSKVNKEKVERLIETGQMTAAGLASIERARQNGSWTVLDEVEALTIPADLATALAQNSAAQTCFAKLSRSDKRAILQWLMQAKRPGTRQIRISEITERAEQGQKPAFLHRPRKQTPGSE